MNGARQVAMNWILPRIKPGDLVLDCGSGDGWLYEKHGNTVSLDNSDSAESNGFMGLKWNMATVPWPTTQASYDVVVSSYALQQLLNDEAGAWLEARKCLKDGGRLLYVGNHSANSDRNYKRDDPNNRLSPDGIVALANACGFKVIESDLFEYNENSYQRGSYETANAICATMEKWQ